MLRDAGSFAAIATLAGCFGTESDERGDSSGAGTSDDGRVLTTQNVCR